MLYRAEHFTTNYYLRASKTPYPRLAGVSNRRGVDLGVAMEAFDSRDCVATAAPTGNRESSATSLCPASSPSPRPMMPNLRCEGRTCGSGCQHRSRCCRSVLGHAAVVTQEAGVVLECRRCRAEHG